MREINPISYFLFLPFTICHLPFLWVTLQKFKCPILRGVSNDPMESCPNLLQLYFTRPTTSSLHFYSLQLTFILLPIFSHRFLTFSLSLRQFLFTFLDSLLGPKIKKPPFLFIKRIRAAIYSWRICLFIEFIHCSIFLHGHYLHHYLLSAFLSSYCSFLCRRVMVS